MSNVVQILSLADASVDQVSVPTILADLHLCSIQVQFSSGTLNGVLTVEADSMQAANLPADWVTVVGSTQAVTAGASHIWNIYAAGYYQVRAKWTATSGTGTVTMIMTQKQDGLNRN